MKQKSKRLSFLVLIFLFTMSINVFTKADGKTVIFINGKEIYTEVDIEIVNNRAMVPIRVISENLGAIVSWDQNEKKITISKGETTNVLYIGKMEAEKIEKGRGETFLLDSAPYIKNSITLVPIRYISENLGQEVKWDKIGNIININTKKPALPIIFSASAVKESVVVGEYVKIFVKTNGEVETVLVINDRNETVTGSNIPDVNLSGVKEWNFSVDSGLEGQRGITIRAYSQGQFVEARVTYTVTKPVPVLDEPRIYYADVKSGTITVGTTVKISVETNDTVEEILLLSADGKTLARTNIPLSTSGKRKEWEILWRPTERGYKDLTVRAKSVDTFSDSPLYVTINESGSTSDRLPFDGRLEDPREDESVRGTVNISGWAVYGETNYVEVFIDNVSIGEARRSTRYDILDNIQNTTGKDYSKATPSPGFNITWDTYNYSNGIYNIRVKVTGSDGRSSIVSERYVNVNN